MKNNISLKAKVFRWGFKIWSNKLVRILKFLEWISNRERYAKIPKFTFRKFNKTKQFINDDLCYVIKCEKTESVNKAFMYIHGGAFISQITKLHWTTIRKLIKDTKSVAYVPIYRLSNPWYSSCKDDVDFLIETYKEMLKNFKPEDISIIGDSAGATLSIVLCQQLKLLKLPRPKNIIALSPALDLSDSFDDINEKSNKNEVLNKPMLAFAHKWYIKVGDNPRDPIYSPMYGDSKDIGFITIFIGQNECFSNQCKQYHQKLINENIAHKYIERENMFHVYPIFPIQESKVDFNLIVSLIMN